MTVRPTIPRTEVDDVLTIDRDRLLRVVEAHLSIVNRTDLAAVLRDLLETARELLHAAHAAVRFVDPTAAPGVDRAVHVGMTDALVAAVDGAPPWQGVLRGVVAQAGPVRHDDLGVTARGRGVRSFLAVPVHTGSRVAGYLYVADPAGARFDDNDEFVLLGIAATAGIALENARRGAEIRMRQQWFGASSEVTQRLIGREEADPLRLVATRIAELADADAASVVLPAGDPGWLCVAESVGRLSAGVAGYRLPVDGTLCGEVMLTGRPCHRADGDPDAPAVADLAPRFGDTLVMPLVGHAGTRGVLVVARAIGRAPFSLLETQMAAVFANHAAVALELLDAQDDRRRVGLLEERERIARDLHDHVIQRLFGTGLRLHSLATVAAPALAEELVAQTAVLDDTIREIRAAIFHLRGTDGSARELRRDLLDVVGEATPGLGFAPRVVLDGPIDTLVPPGVADDVVAVVREALANVVRHAGATTVEVGVRATSDLVAIDVVDDGTGVGESSRRSGLANLATRAQGHGGTAGFVPAGRGTHLRVELPLRPAW